MDSEIGGTVRSQALSFHPVTKLRLHQPIGVLSLEKEHYVKKERLSFPARNNAVKVKIRRRYWSLFLSGFPQHLTPAQ